MFTIEKTEIARAIEGARALHPKVRMVRFGLYEVSGSGGDTYAVRCWRDRAGRHVDCTCRTRDGVACKHSMAAVSLHIAVARLRRGHSNRRACRQRGRRRATPEQTGAEGVGS
jgi:uncharacterized Zn finger protein